MATTKNATAKKATAPKKAPVKESEQLEIIPTKPEPVIPEKEIMVSYVIPRDPAFQSNDQFFEYNLNGINYRFRRGEILTHPKYLYDAVTAKLFARERINTSVAEFMDGKGKRLDRD